MKQFKTPNGLVSLCETSPGGQRFFQTLFETTGHHHQAPAWSGFELTLGRNNAAPVGRWNNRNFKQGENMKFKRHAEQWQRLFKHKAGRIDIEIWGPRIGWKKRAISVCRWRPSTKDPSGFDRIYWFEERDLVHLEKCIKQARLWCKADNGTASEDG